MNDAQIREQFHRKRLAKYHSDVDTIVVDELGLQHGRCRADIAVLNGNLIGYEIKSDCDTLRRLPSQVSVYSAVFDRVSLIVGLRHAEAARSLIPSWWGLVVSSVGPRGGVSFNTVRKPAPNRKVDPYSVAQLLWRDEAAAILEGLGANKRLLRSPRRFLYEALTSELGLADLRGHVRQCLKSRRTWRGPEPPPPNGDLSRPSAR